MGRRKRVGGVGNIKEGGAALANGDADGAPLLGLARASLL
jgi:hypothetical protein